MERTVGAVGVIDKVVAILAALEEGPVGLSDIARRTGVAKPTVHRLCTALEHHGLVAREGELRTLGARVDELAHAVPSLRYRLIHVSENALHELRDESGESVQLYVREGNVRRCVAGLESLHGLRTIVEVGATLPLAVGSAGAILREDARALEHGWAESVEERERGVASVSAGVLDASGAVIAAVSVSGPIERTTRAPARLYATAVQRAAHKIERELR